MSVSKMNISYQEAVASALNAGFVVGNMLEEIDPRDEKQSAVTVALCDTVLQGGIIFGLLAVAAAIREGGADGEGTEDMLGKLFGFPKRG